MFYQLANFYSTTNNRWMIITLQINNHRS